MKKSHFKFSMKISLIFSSTLFLSTLVLMQSWIDAKTTEIARLDQEITLAQAKMMKDQLAFDQLQKRAPASVETTLASQLLEQYLKFNGRFSSVVNGIVLSSNGNSFALNKILSESQVQSVGYTQTLYSIEAEASFIAIGKFLEKMEDSPLLTEIDSIEITRIGSEMKRCKAKIKLFSYVGASL